VLGVFEDAAYEQGALTLGRGDVVVLFSDGVTEALNQAEEEFTDERLLQALAPLRGAGPQAIVDAVASAVRAFCGDATPIDDLTVVAVRYDG
jgi:sigma-B regulation protein RsbU (phosphoserine phosphatase)